MHFLNYQEFSAALFKNDTMDGFCYGRSAARDDKYLRGKKGTLKKGFQTYTVTLPDGREVSIEEDGGISVKLSGQDEKQIFMPDKMRKLAID